MSESPIFVKTQTYVVWILERTERFRKSQRYVIALRIQNTILDFQEQIIIAAKNHNSLKDLQKADMQLEILKRHIRTSVDMHLLTVKQYAYSANCITEIGKLLGGWIASNRSDRQNVTTAVGSETDNSGSAGRVVEQQRQQLPFCQPQQEQP